MDDSPYTILDDYELVLRQHIRDLLDDYVCAHLTTDHVDYSNALASETLSKVLKPIPNHGPGEIALPVDPYESLKAKFKFDSLQPYDEVWNPSPDAFALLKDAYKAEKKVPRTQTVWGDEDEVDFEWMPHRPMTPLLSRSSLSKTPSLGKVRLKKTTLADSLSVRGIRQVATDDIPEENPPKLEDCLDLKLTIGASLHQDMIELQKRTPFLNRPVSRPLPAYAAEYLQRRSPDYREKFGQLSPPMFPRERRVRPEKMEREVNIFGPIKPIPVDVREVEQDFAADSMKVVDGWMTLSSSDSIPSLSSGASEVDELIDDAELWKLSSSAAEPTPIETLESMKMEEPLFPRSGYPRSGRPDSANRDPKQSFSSFISSKIRSNRGPRILTSPKSEDILPKLEPSSPSVHRISLSMLGQPPSSDGSAAFPSNSATDPCYEDLRRILKFHNAGNELKSYQDIIMDERLDEKETMFMDVPKLPPPNGYLRDNTSNKARNALRNIAYSERSERSVFRLPVHFKKITGVKSLNLELSWRPFSFGSKIPTHTELIRVDALLTGNSSVSDEGCPTTDSVQELLSHLPFSIDPEDKTGDAISSPEFDPRILRDARDTYILTVSSISYGNFGEDTILLSRCDRYGFGLRPTHIGAQRLSDEALAINEFQSNDSSDFSSAITPDLDDQLPLTGSVHEPCAYRPPLAYDSLDQISSFRRSDSYCGTHPDPDAYRHPKKRRLTLDETDALCAMEAMSQSIPITINPKDLMLPQSSNVLSQIPYDVDLATVPLDSQQSIFISQSQSLSLSLNDFNDLQDVPSFDTADETKTCDNEGFGPSYGRNAMLAPINYDAPLQPDVLYDPDPGDTERLHQQGEGATHYNDISQAPSGRQIDSSAIQESMQEAETNRTELQPNPPGTRRLLYNPSTSPALFSDQDKLSLFLQLRGKKGPGNVSVELTKPPVSDAAIDEKANDASPQDVSIRTFHRAPEDLLADTRAFIAPSKLDNPTTLRTYLVSLDFVQQRRLVCALSSYNVRLVERDTLTPISSSTCSDPLTPKPHSADISVIVGPHSGVVFFPLSALPSTSTYKTLLDALASYSWRFSSLLLVLVTFPRSQMLRATEATRVSIDMPSSYSPPAMKAARRVRRDLALREGTGEKRVSCTVELSFADDIDEAARLVRNFSDLALKDLQHDLNAYIGEEERDGESDLAEMEGMNAFCAAMILQCCALEEFLDMPPDQRMEGLADLIGLERIEYVNTVLANRMSEMDSVSYSSSLNV